MVPEQIEREVVIAAPIERVWATITRPEHVGAWFGDAGAEIDLRPGGAMTITWKSHGTSHAVVERVEAPRVFAYRWARPAHQEVREGNSTLVEFILAPEGDGTRLRVVESGFRALELTPEEQAGYAEGNTRGWRSEIDELVGYIAAAVIETGAGGAPFVPDSIQREVVIAAPIERVWATITQAEHVGTWFGDAGAEIDLRPGGVILIHWADYGTGYGFVERVEPPRAFSFRGALIGHTEVRADNSTVVEFTLSEEGDGTRLRVVESGFRSLAVPADEAAKQAEGNVEGWRIKTAELAEYVAGVAA